MDALLSLALAQVARLEVSTNNLLHGLIESDTDVQDSLLGHLSDVCGTDLRSCSVQREHVVHEEDPAGGRKRSFHDFALLEDGVLKASIETKIDASVTSLDQISKYLGHLSAAGVLFVVTPGYGYASMRDEISAQVRTAPADVQSGAATHWRLAPVDKHVYLLRWSELLDFPSAPGSLGLLSASIEATQKWRPFSPLMLSPLQGSLVVQVQEMALELKKTLESEFTARSWPCQPFRVNEDIGVSVVLRGHPVHVGHMPLAWARDPAAYFPQDRRGEMPGSPFWIIAAKAGEAAVREHKPTSATFHRLRQLLAERPLPLMTNVPRQRVLEDVTRAVMTALLELEQAL